jgi:hypothetical protein
MGNPVIASISTMIVVASGLTAFGTITGAYNDSHTTAEELINSHPVSEAEFIRLQLSIDDNDAISKCRWLKSEIRALEDSIYVRRRDSQNGDFIHNLELDLADLKEQYQDLNCIRRLSS